MRHQFDHARGFSVSGAFFAFVLVVPFLAASCVSWGAKPVEPPVPPMSPVEKKYPSVYLDAPGTRSAEELVAFFLAGNPDGDRAKVGRMARYYVRECAAEGMNSDVAFVQMCLETGYLRFGGLVTEDMNNFCGLGAIDTERRGNRFETEELGVRAHVQHLHAYGTTRELAQECIDPRYKWVSPRGKAPTVYELAGTWAADREYGNKLAALLDRLAQY